MTEALPDFSLTLTLAKRGEMAWLGHLDTARSLERALRRALLPLRFTVGFHKRIKVRLPEPLPLGVGSDAERYVVQFAAPVDPDALLAQLAGALPRGLAVLAVVAGSHPEPKDAPIALELEAEAAGELAAVLAALPDPLPTMNGRWSIARPVLPQPDGGATALLLLEAPPGGRVSVGRFLEALRAATPQGVALRRMQRIAWQPAPASLPSPAPFPPGSPAADAAGSSGAEGG